MAFVPAQWGFVFERAWVFSLLAPLICLVILAHFLQARRRPVSVPSLLPWADWKSRIRSGSRVRRKISPKIFLHVLFVSTAVLAATGPGWLGSAPKPFTLLVYFDRSASMNAPSPLGGTRLDAARRVLDEELSSLPSGSRILLRGFPPLPEGELEINLESVSARVKEIPPSQAPGHLAQAFRETGFHASTGEVDGILAISDGAGPPFPRRKGTRFRLVGGDTGNTGFEAFSVDPTGKGTYRIFLRVRNASNRAVTLPFTVRVDDKLLGESQTLTLDADAVRGVTLFPQGVEIPATGVIEVRMDTPDAWKGDDRVWAAPVQHTERTIVLGGSDAPYLDRVLRSIEGVDLQVLAGKEIPGGLEPALYVFHQTVPAKPPGDAPAVVVDPKAGFWGISLRALKGDEAVSLEGPLQEAATGFAELRFSRLTAASPLPRGGTPLARFRGESVVFRIQPPGAPPRWVVGLPVDAEASSWPLTPWFPIFWKTLVDVSMEREGTGTAFGFRRTGERVGIPIRGGRLGRVHGPGGERIPATLVGRRIVFLAASAGIYRFQEQAGGRERMIAVNLLEREELDLRGREGGEGALPEIEDPDLQGLAFPLKEAAAGLAMVLLLAILLLEIPRRRVLALALLFTGLLCLSCGSSSKGTGGKEPQDLKPGMPLPPVKKAESPEASETCSACGRPSGAGHRCGVSAWCSRCGREGSLKEHVCGVSRFCERCGREAALTGHRCGETRFCPSCKMEVPHGHEHNGEGGKPWGTIR
ncbi:MAG: hypothetical protein ACYTHM_10690 [Planctomycetota bacterium]|jgi:hypothetical protein